MQSFILLTVALASMASAAPATLETRAAPSFSCLEAFSSCLTNNGYNGQSTSEAAVECSKKIESCGKCAQQETHCLSTAFTSAKAPAGPSCFTQAALCYQEAWNPYTTNGPYFDCGSAVALCDSEPFANHAYCASVASQCRTCQANEKKCRTPSGASAPYCNNETQKCFSKAVGGK